jgi:ring-1,2-phenylacetyl-CoA epoxidase subunit PaaD
MRSAELVARESAAWAALQQVPDPELPLVSVVDLGIVRDVHADATGLHVVLTPTYSGCPATEVITDSVRAAIDTAGLGPAHVRQQLAPAWTTDWITERGREALRASGIAPPAPLPAAGGAVPIRLQLHAIACPHCGGRNTERLSAFGSTACKALHRCQACREPFEHFKPL